MLTIVPIDRTAADEAADSSWVRRIAAFAASSTDIDVAVQVLGSFCAYATWRSAAVASPASTRWRCATNGVANLSVQSRSFASMRNSTSRSESVCGRIRARLKSSATPAASLFIRSRCRSSPVSR